MKKIFCGEFDPMGNDMGSEDRKTILDSSSGYIRENLF